MIKRHKILLIVVTESVLFSLSACAMRPAVLQPGAASSAGSVSSAAASAVSSSQSTGSGATAVSAASSSRPQSARPASSAVKSASSAAASKAVSADETDYSAYSGSWVEQGVTDLATTGGTGFQLKISRDGHASGSVTTTTAGLSHIAQADFSGVIENGTLTADFSEDNWGHSGTVTFQFLKDEIDLNVTIKSGPEGMTLRPGQMRAVRQR